MKNYTGKIFRAIKNNKISWLFKLQLWQGGFDIDFVIAIWNSGKAIIYTNLSLKLS